jgi:hypothetical protein
MSWRMQSLNLPKSALFGFLGAGLIAAAAAMTSRIGVVETDLANRIIGLALGLMIVLIGNSLPKLRPFNRTRVNMRPATVERFSGWLLVLAGISWVTLFTLAPLYEAKRVAALIGIGALTIVAVSWIWAAVAAVRTGASLASSVEEEATPTASERVALKWQLTVSLLFAFFYVFVVACLKFLVNQTEFANELSIWMLTAFWVLYALLYALGHRKGRQ